MDDAERELRAVLEREADRIDAQRFVLDRGRTFVPVERPADVPAGERHQTFRNALALARERPELRYCEGYSLPVGAWDSANRHAWCADAQGRAIVVAPGWAEPDGRLRAVYLGVALPLAVAAPHAERGTGALYEYTNRMGELAAALD